jgi:hypothetical protein
MAESMALSAAQLEAAFRATIARLALYDPVRAFGSAGAGPGGSTSTVPSSTIFNAPKYDPLSSLTVTTQDLADTGFRYDPLSGMRATAQDIRITVDTSGSGDKLSQAIAESIQIATRSGYSTTPAGFL